MKRFLFICCFCLWCFPAFSQEEAGKIILDLDENQAAEKEIGFVNMFETAVEVGDYFDKNYPGVLIETDLKPDIEKFFPDLSSQQLYDREDFIRGSIKLFRWGKEKIAEIKSKFLVPDTPILTYKDSEYENPEDYTYVDVGDDNVLVTTDIKKVISYSHDPKEIETYEAYKERKEDYAKLEEAFPGVMRLKRVYDKIEFKKLPFYGLLYDDPKTEGEGLSPFIEEKHASIRLISEYSRLEGHSQMRGAVQFLLDKDWSLLAQAYGKYPEVTIHFEKSENIKSCDLFRPVPQRRLFEDGDLIAYHNNFAYPFVCSIDDIEKPAVINAKVLYSLCDASKVCFKNEVSLNLKLKEGLGFSTVMRNFITQSFSHLPRMQDDDVIVHDFSMEENKQSPSGQILRLVVEASDRINKPEFFFRTSDNISFGRPRLAVDDNRISARVDVLSIGADLKNKPVELTFTTNGFTYYRINKDVTSESLFDINSQHLTIGLVFLAILGGFLLNFMPCVFPVLSLKILSLTQFGAKNEQQVRRSFILSSLGIFSGFLCLIAILVGLKYLGKSLGWGMQFQNPLFIIIMIFAVLIFLAQLNGIISLDFIPRDKLQKQKFTPNKEAFFSGLLVVLMATPCTGPYLGTTIGFALSGTPLDICIILLAVALGISLPYLILSCLPDLSSFIPHPGPWMKKIHHFMNLMLVLTLIWLCSLLPAQSSWVAMFSILLFALLFFGVLYMYRFSFNEVESSVKSTELRQRTIKKLKWLYTLFLTILFGSALAIGFVSFHNHKNKVAEYRVSQLDFNQIGKDVQKGYNVLVKVGADWCLTCSYNNFLVFDNVGTENLIKQYNLKIVEVDWTTYNSEILNFMGEYGRRGLPFYILYNRNIPEGLVLPEVLSFMTFKNILDGSGVVEHIPEEDNTEK